jgi:hypothetical protein
VSQKLYFLFGTLMWNITHRNYQHPNRDDGQK